MCDKVSCYTCKSFDWEGTITFGREEIEASDQWPEDIVCVHEAEAAAYFGDDASGWVSVHSAISCEDYEPLSALEEWQRTLAVAKRLYGVKA